MLCRTLLKAIAYCHENNIAHRDLKPENLLLIRRDNDLQLKISDFGFAKRVTSSTCLTTRCGSPNYVAPEIIARKPYGTPVDMWSIGVVIYILLCGYLPFADKSHVILYRKIQQARYQFHTQYWNGISKDAKDFITMLLERDPNQRLTARHAAQHWWLRPRQEEYKDAKNVIIDDERIGNVDTEEMNEDISTASNNIKSVDLISKNKVVVTTNINPAHDSDEDTNPLTETDSYDDDVEKISMKASSNIENNETENIDKRSEENVLQVRENCQQNSCGANNMSPNHAILFVPGRGVAVQ